MIPHFELQENEKTWLREAWALLLATGEKPDYLTVRRNTLSKTGPQFIPTKINNLLIRDKATEITFLGVLHIDDKEKIMSQAEKILLLIKEKLLASGSQQTLFISDLTAELDLDAKYARIIFGLLTEYGHVYDGATGRAEIKGKYSYDEYRFTSDELFESYLAFQSLEEKISKYYESRKGDADPTHWKSKQIGNSNLWLDQNGNLQQTAHGYSHFGPHFPLQPVFISPSRIKELIHITSEFDLSKLLHLCKEINFNYIYGNFYSVVLLTRALIDHVPPIFDCQSFREVANNYKSENNSRSFSKSMDHLDKSLRNIGDSLIHSQIRKSEVSPNETQIDFKNDLDVLLGEVVRILR